MEPATLQPRWEQGGALVEASAVAKREVEEIKRALAHEETSSALVLTIKENQALKAELEALRRRLNVQNARMLSLFSASLSSTHRVFFDADGSLDLSPCSTASEEAGSMSCD